MVDELKFYIKTQRLVLRDLLTSDVAGMFELDSDAEVHRFLGNKPVKSLDESKNVIEIIRAQYEANGIGRWAVIEQESGNFIGWAGLKLMTEPLNGKVGFYDLGYRFIKRYWGNGYATEAALAAVAFAHNVMKLKEIYGMANIDNIASRTVLEKTGMQYLNTFAYDEDTQVAFYKLVL